MSSDGDLEIFWRARLAMLVESVPQVPEANSQRKPR